MKKPRFAGKGYLQTGVPGSEMFKLFKIMGNRPWFEPGKVSKLSGKDLHGYLMFQKDIITLMYQKHHWKPHKLANAFGIDDKLMIYYLRRWKILRPADIWTDETVLRRFKNRIIRWRTKDQLAIHEIAEKLGLYNSTVSRALRQWDVPKPMRRLGKSQFLLKNKEKIIRLYTRDQNPLPAAAIAQRLGLSESGVMQSLKRWGIPARSYQKAHTSSVVALYRKGYSPQEIATKYGVDPTQIYKHLTRSGIYHTKKRIFTDKELRFLYDLIVIKKMPATKAAKLFNIEIRKLPIEPRLKKKRLVTPIILYRLINEKGWKDTKVSELEENVLRYIILGIPEERILANFDISREHYQALVDKFGKRGDEYIPKRRKYKRYTPEQLKALAKEIKNLRKERMTIERIASKLKTSTTIVSKIIRRYDIPFHGRKKAYSKSDIIELHEKGFYPGQIGRRVGAASSSVSLVIRNAGMRPRAAPKRGRYTEEAQKAQRRFIKKFYSAPHYYSIGQLAKFLRIDKTTVTQRLQEAGVKVRSNQKGKELRKLKRRPLGDFVTNRLYNKMRRRETIQK